MRSLRRMFGFVKPYRVKAIIALILLLGMVGADLLIPRLTQRIIDRGIAAQNMHVIATTALIMVGVALLSALFSVGNTILSVSVAQGFAADVRSSIVHKVQTFSFGNLDRLRTGKLLVRTTSDVNMVQSIVAISLRILTRGPAWIAGSIVMLVLTSRELSAVMACFLPFIALTIILFMRKAQPLFLLVQKALDRLNGVLQENLAGMRLIKAFVRVGHEKERFDDANTKLMRENISVMELMALLIPTMLLIVNLGVVGAVWFGGASVIGGSLTPGQLVASINYMSFALFPILMLAGMVGPLSAADASSARILEVLDTDADVKEKKGARSLEDVEGRVEFENVSFSYLRDGNDAVLKGINLVVEPGETVAILGATGAGKSSLIHLIARFYDVAAGCVKIDGVDVRDIELHSLRTHIGLALQEAILFGGTIRDNICYGRPEASEEEIIAAAVAAQAHTFITALPDRYDTKVGERGVTLSGGEKQRIAIARALLVRPKILILDDSTSAVDVETEALLQDALDSLIAQSQHTTTRLIVAQRISTVLLADKIVVLDQGEVAAIGTHADLLATSPIYQEIYRSQLGDGGAPHV
ncbi:MAG: ABC transporter ATP-binding protein [Candidatus Bipolaricaulota bacterium]|nr:ABC transporter ATP-binding protein [Candidatus Bipolaricaulota bacterium]